MKPIFLILIITGVLSLFSCPETPSYTAREMGFPDLKAPIDDQIKGYEAVIEFGEISIGSSAYKQLRIQNSGTEELVITDIAFYRDVYDGSGKITDIETIQQVFVYAEGCNPDFPVSVSAGTTLESLFLKSTPPDLGLNTGTLAITSNQGHRRLLLRATGMWDLTLSVNSAAQGNIVKPIAVAYGDQPTVYRTSVAVVDLEAIPIGFLVDFAQWSQLSGAAATFSDANSRITTVTLTGHGAIEAQFYNPYVFVQAVGGNDGNNGLTSVTPVQTLAQGLIIYNANKGLALPNSKEGIVVATGNYTISADFLYPDFMSLRGGYAPGFASRTDITDPAVRAASGTNVTLTGAAAISAGSTVTNTALIEGFTFISNTTGRLFSCTGGDPTIQYNTFSGNAAADPNVGAIIYCNNASPVIQDNIITGRPGQFRSLGIYLSDHASPTILNNSITAGNTTGEDGVSAAIYMDYYCEPLISGNELTGGTSSGTSGRSYGIYGVNSCVPRITGNKINGGSGSSLAAAVYATYAGRYTLENNWIFTTGGNRRYGFFLGPNSRLDRFSGNNVYDCSTAMIFTYIEQQSLTTIDAVNDSYGPVETGLTFGDEQPEANISDPNTQWSRSYE